MARNTDPSNVADSVVVASVRLVRTLRVLKQSDDLTEPEISALTAIVYAKGIAARDLVSLEGVTPATISRLVTAMEAKGLVRRTPDVRDARQQLIAATALGARRVREGQRRRVTPLAKVIATLPRDEQKTLAAAAVILESVIAKVQARA